MVRTYLKRALAFSASDLGLFRFYSVGRIERYKTCQKTLTRLCIKLELKENTMKRLILIAFGAFLTLALSVPGWSQNTTGNTTQSQTKTQPTTSQKETKEEKKARKEAERAKKKADKNTKNKQDTTTTNKKY